MRLVLDVQDDHVKLQIVDVQHGPQQADPSLSVDEEVAGPVRLSCCIQPNGYIKIGMHVPGQKALLLKKKVPPAPPCLKKINRRNKKQPQVRDDLG